MSKLKVEMRGRKLYVDGKWVSHNRLREIVKFMAGESRFATGEMQDPSAAMDQAEVIDYEEKMLLSVIAFFIPKSERRRKKSIQGGE